MYYCENSEHYDTQIHNDENHQINKISGSKKNSPNNNSFVSCECPELMTWHPGRVEHKMKCTKFWSLNPNRTKDELLQDEGFVQ